MPGVWRTRSRACSVESTRVSHYRFAETVRHSLRDWFLTAYLRALPGVPGFLATVACAFVTHKLDPSVGRSGPHDFAVREGKHSSHAAIASIASRVRHS